MHGAGGETIRHYGRVEIVLRVGRETVRLHLEVAEARRSLLSVFTMVDAGWRVSFDGRSPRPTNGVKELILTRKRGLYLLEGEILDARRDDLEKKSSALVMSVEESENTTLKEDAQEKSTLQPMEIGMPETPRPRSCATT